MTKIQKILLLFSMLLMTYGILPSFSFAADTHGYGQGNCAGGSICYDGNYNSDRLRPGYQCGALTDWHFGTDGKSPAGVPACGLFGRFCCDPGPATLNPATDSSLPFPANCTSKTTGGGCAAVETSFGPIPTNASDLVGKVFSILLSLSGGIAVLLIIAGGYQLAVSQGNPEKVKEARERIVAAITGLLFIIFSVLILRVIGFDILRLPGFQP